MLNLAPGPRRPAPVRYSPLRGFDPDVLPNPDWKDSIAEGLRPEYAEDIPMDLLGLITGLPAEAPQIPWDGPTVRIIEHQAHAPGHAALLIEECGVLVAGDMLSDILMPFLDLQAANPIEDYLAALRLFESVADDVVAVVPGHGSVGGAGRCGRESGRTAHTWKHCTTAVFPTTCASALRPRLTGCPKCINGSCSGSPKDASASERAFAGKPH